MTTATAIASPNIAFIKYWGDQDPCLRIPVNGSISMNLDSLFTRTNVTVDPNLNTDTLSLNGDPLTGQPLERVTGLLDTVRQMADIPYHAAVKSENNFPTGAGIASSASAFAALSLAASTAAGLHLSEPELSRLARTGSGSACRSIPAGFVEWRAGTSDEDSFAFSIAPPEHWDLVDCIALVSREQKRTGSTQGHALAETSPLQLARVSDAPRRLDICRRAIHQRNFEVLAEVVEQDSNLMHAVIMTSTPLILYWQAETIAVMHAVNKWRAEGLRVCYTVDAGPNVHVLCPGEYEPVVVERLSAVQGVQQVLKARPGGPARLVDW
jgi:diphosphomevalonate decarboxylase